MKYRARSFRPVPGQPLALLDFGSSGTRAAIVRLSDAGAEVLGVGRASGRSGIARPGQVMRRAQISALAEAALSAAEQDTRVAASAATIADDALVGLTGPFLQAHPEIHHFRRRADTPLYAAQLRMALADVQRQSLGVLTNAFQNAPIRRTLVASQLVGVWLVQHEANRAHRLIELAGGVPVAGGDTLSIALCNLSWPTQGLQMVADVLDDLDLALHDVVPQAQALAVALPRPDAILLDIGADHTEIALVRAGALSALTHLSRGGSFFTQELVRRLQLSPDKAELVKQRAAQQPISPRSPAGRVLTAAVSRWRRDVARALARLAEDGPLPPLLYFFGGGAQLPLLFEGLRHFPWSDRLPFERTPDVQRLSPFQLRGVRDPRGLLHGSGSVGLAALAAWLGCTPSPLQQQLDHATHEIVSSLRLT